MIRYRCFHDNVPQGQITMRTMTRSDWAWFIGITIGALAVYIVYTVSITEWRTNFRRTMNELDSRANTRAVMSERSPLGCRSRIW